MKVKFRHSETKRVHTVRDMNLDYYILETHPMNWSSDCFVAVRKTAVTLVLDEPVYCCGQQFTVEYGAERHLLAQTGAHMAALIEVKNGNRYREPIEIADPYKITQVELKRMGGSLVKLVKST